MARAARRFIDSGEQLASAPRAPQPETNTHWIGRYSATPYFVSISLRQNPATDVQPVAPIAETQPHFIGKFTAPKHQLLPGLRQNFDSVSSSAFVPETNVNWLGRFTAATFLNPLALRQNSATDLQPPADGASGTFVVAYDNNWLSLSIAWRWLYENPATDLQPQPETNTHWVGRYTAATYANPIPLRQNPAVDLPPIQPETNTNWLGRYAATNYANPIPLRQNSANDVPPQPETNTNFVGKFTATTFTNALALRQNSATDLPPVQAETNTNWLGRFAANQYTVSISLRQNQPNDGPSAPIQPDTGQNFIGRFAPTVHLNPILLRQAPALDKQPIQPETNTNFIGRFRPGQHTLPAGLYWMQSVDGPPTPPPPVVVPPGGSGKRYQPPTDYLPEPGWDEKPRKPVQPIWDRKRGADEDEALEQPQKQPALSSKPPLPPLSIFRGTPGFDPRKLPTFDQYMVPDALGLAQRLHQAKRQSEADEREALEALIAAGLLRQ